MPGSPTRPRPSLALLATAVVVLGLSLYNAVQVRSGSRAPDDCFITLRYAENLAGGEGFRWNPGGERVEGFSSPLHLLLLAGPVAVGIPPLHLSQLSSLLPAMATILLTLVWGWRHLSPLWGVTAALTVGLSPSFSMWSRGGLETPLYALLVLGAVVAANAQRRGWLTVLLGLMAWTRPEAPLAVGAVVGGAFVAWGHDRRALGQALRVAAGAVAIFLPWFLFRLAYFGYPVANTYYAKMDGVRSAQVTRGFDYVGQFLGLSEIHTPLIVGVVGLLVFLATRRRHTTGPTGAWPVFAVLLLLAAAAFAVVAGGDWMPQYRFLTPAIPLIALLGAGGAAAAAARVPGRRTRAAASIALALVLLSQPLRIFMHDVKSPHYPLDRAPRLVEFDNDRTTSRLFRLGMALGRSQPPDAVVAVVPAGAIPYASRLPAIDMLGLNDTALAHEAVADMGAGRQAHEKGDGTLILARRPDLILLDHSPNAVFGEPAAPGPGYLVYRPVRQIWENPAFHADYEPFVVAIDDSTSYTLYRRIAD